MSWTIQGSCVDLILMALEYTLNSNKVELRGHFHDSVYLACLCSDPYPNCPQSKQIVSELLALYKEISWPNTNIPVFKFGDIEWTMLKGVDNA